MDINYSDLRYFLEVTDTLNISRAAERLGIAQPSLSAAIKRLEQDVGAELLLRSKQGVRLTKAGGVLRDRANDFLHAWEDLRSEVLKTDKDISGLYTLGCHVSVAQYTLPHFLPSILEKHSRLEIKLKHDLSRKITELVISGALDFGIVVNPVRHPDLVIKELYKDEVTFWIDRRAKTPSHDPVLYFDPHLTQSQTLLRKTKVRFQNCRKVHSTSLDTIAKLISSGAGIGILPETVANAAAPNELIRLSHKLPVYKDRICLVYAAQNPKSLAFKAIRDAALSLQK